MNWLARLKELDEVPGSVPTKPTKPPFVGFVGACSEHLQNSVGEPDAAENHSEPANDANAPDDIFMARVALFTDRRLPLEDAEAMAERLARRDVERDERRLCLECLHLFGGEDGRRCSQWRKIGQINGAAIPGELVTLLQRCNAFGNRLEGKA